jgi:hypothetical protein
MGTEIPRCISDTSMMTGLFQATLLLSCFDVGCGRGPGAARAFPFRTLLPDFNALFKPPFDLTVRP